MSHWPSIKASRLLAALLKIGWSVKRQFGGSWQAYFIPSKYSHCERSEAIQAVEKTRKTGLLRYLTLDCFATSFLAKTLIIVEVLT